jgi:hypothetical protein
MQINIGLWDVTFVVVASFHATGIAYVAQPRWKALLATLPLPFTIAVLAVGRPVGPSNVLGLLLLVLFLQEVRWLHNQKSVPIVPAIALSALTFGVLGGLITPVLPDTAAMFWITASAAWLLAAVFLFRMPSRTEIGHRSPLPVYLKLPIVVMIVVALLVVKELLQGFVTVFPIVTIVAAYEARHSLWTLGRQLSVLLVAMIPMIAAIRLAEVSLSIGPALLVGWGVFLALYVPITWWHLFGREDTASECVSASTVCGHLTDPEKSSGLFRD